MISFLMSKKGIYLIGIAGLVASFFMLKTHYTNVGILQCQTKITKAVLAETKRMASINLETLHDAHNKLKELQDEKNELSNLLFESENANDIEPDGECYSANRLYRVNRIGNKEN